MELVTWFLFPSWLMGLQKKHTYSCIIGSDRFYCQISDELRFSRGKKKKKKDITEWAKKHLYFCGAVAGTRGFNAFY